MKTSRKLAIHLDAGQITCCLWTRTLPRWRIAAKESFPLQSAPMADQVLAAVRGLVIRWKLAPDTPVIVQALPGTGGTLCFDLPAGAKGNPLPLIEAELAKALPFPLREIHYAWELEKSADAARVSLFWMPSAWVADLSGALSRIGLRLTEIVARAQLVAHALRPASAPFWAFLESDKDQAYLHTFWGALPAWTSSQATQQTDLALETLLLATSPAPAIDLFYTSPEAPTALLAGGKLRGQRKEALDYPELLLRWYRAGKAGILIDPERSALLARLTPAAIAILLLGLAAVGGMWWLTQATQAERDALEQQVKKIRPTALAVAATERRVAEHKQATAALDRLYTEPDGLDALDAVARKLPKKAWLVRFNFHDGLFEAEGYGGDTDALLEKLKGTKGFSGAGRCEPQLATDAKLKPFCIGARLGKAGQ
ncbi:MAG: hypothetical protein HY850_07375 [Betaproteobacteria bacterium]|nr:hypothetical protein [Betaproteobacteria bacterium]